jgi:membrane-associated phospholipid phosphatase
MVFFAGSFARLNPDSGARGWVWGGCLTAAAATGVLRWVAGRHFPTDILAGAAVGATAGWLVPRLHEADDAPGAGGGGGARLAFGFAF